MWVVCEQHQCSPLIWKISTIAWKSTFCPTGFWKLPKEHQRDAPTTNLFLRCFFCFFTFLLLNSICCPFPACSQNIRKGENWLNFCKNYFLKRLVFVVSKEQHIYIIIMNHLCIYFLAYCYYSNGIVNSGECLIQPIITSAHYKMNIICIM